MVNLHIDPISRGIWRVQIRIFGRVYSSRRVVGDFNAAEMAGKDEYKEVSAMPTSQLQAIYPRLDEPKDWDPAKDR